MCTLPWGHTQWMGIVKFPWWGADRVKFKSDESPDCGDSLHTVIYNSITSHHCGILRGVISHISWYPSERTSFCQRNLGLQLVVILISTPLFADCAVTGQDTAGESGLAWCLFLQTTNLTWLAPWCHQRISNSILTVPLSPRQSEKRKNVIFLEVFFTKRYLYFHPCEPTRWKQFPFVRGGWIGQTTWTNIFFSVLFQKVSYKFRLFQFKN